MTDELRDRVVHERSRRGLSISAAARTGGASHETWRTYEETGKLTPKVVQMVAAAFAWPLGWHQGEVPPEEESHEWLNEAAEQFAEQLAERVDAVLNAVERSRLADVARAEQFAERLTRYEELIGCLIEAVGQLEHRLPAPADPPPSRSNGPSAAAKRTSTRATRSRRNASK